MAKKYRDVKRALRAAGWERQRIAGSHEIWAHPDRAPVVVPGGGKDNLEVPVGTLANIRKRTGLKDLR
jgi:predicted RNA binding protein YcfA (HicA-like mRNA interferase family)